MIFKLMTFYLSKIKKSKNTYVWFFQSNIIFFIWPSPWKRHKTKYTELITGFKITCERMFYDIN